MQIEVHGDIERALFHFKRKIAQDGILREFRLKTFYETRGQRRARKDRMALKRLRQREKRLRGWERE